MSKTVDQRVVEMRFDNQQFERNVSTTMSTLEKLKQSLNLTGATKGLESINSASKSVNMSALGSAVETVQAKFSALEVMGVTALANITNSAVNAGKRIASALTIDPIKTGFSEYETQINAVQTILANTSSKGTELKDVNKALDDLNKYADQTIYNFTEMTRNIGTFTAAGVDLDTSVKSIKGIANLAAVSGSTSQQASNAMYQLSQALAAGKVSLMDWNSVVNAGMGGEVFQNALKNTAKALGTNVDAMIEKYGSFRESLTKGEWLTTEVLTKTLEQFTMAAEKGSDEWNAYKKSLMEDGFTEKQAEEILKMANTATDAATKVKTFSQLWDTLKEAAQSGWTQTWEIIVGDFEEAKGLLTEVSNVIGDIINNSSNARNALLQGWKDAGGRTMAIEGIKNAFEGIMAIIGPIKEAFREVFPPTTSKQLVGITKSFVELTAKFKEFATNDDTVRSIKSIFTGIFSAFAIGIDIIKAVIGGIGDLLANFTGATGGILGAVAAVGDWITNLRSSIKEADIFSVVVNKITGFISSAITSLKQFGTSMKEALRIPGHEGFTNFLKLVWDFVSKIGSSVGEAFSSIGSVLREAFGGFYLDNILSTGLFAGLALGIKKVVDILREILDGGGGLLENITGILDDVRGAFEAYQSNLKAEVLKKIAIAIGILAASLFVISTIEPSKLDSSLGALTVLFAELMGTLAIFSKLSGGRLKGVIKSVGMMVGMSTAVILLAGALKILSTIDSDAMASGLVSIGILMAEMLAFLAVSKYIGKAQTNAAGLVVLAGAMLIMAKAVEKFGSMDWGTIGKGVVAIGVILAELAGFSFVAGKADAIVSTGLAMIALGVAMKIFASVVKDFGETDIDKLMVGLTALAAVLAELAIAMRFMPTSGAIATGVGLIAVGAALKILANVLGDFGSMNWGEIGKGLVAMGGALAELAIALRLMTGTISGAAALVVAAGALAILAPVMKILGTLTWGEIGKGLIAVAGAFAVIGVAGTLLTPLVPTILSLAAAFALFGVATLGIGVGLGLIAAGITALAVACTAGVTSIVASLTIIVMGIADLIPQLAIKLGEAIAEFCKVIGEYAPQIAEAVLKLILEVLQACETYAPQIVDSLAGLLIGVMNSLADHVPDLIQAAMNVIGAFFQGIVDALNGLNTESLFKGVIAVGLLSGLMIALSTVAGLVPGAMVGVLGVGAVIAELALVLGAVGLLAQIPGLSWLMEKGGNFLEVIGTAIGKFIGGLVGGIAQGATSSLPAIGTDLSNFMANIKPFIDGASMINDTAVAGVRALADAILTITAASILDGIAFWITGGGSSISEFGSQLGQLGSDLSTFAANLGNFDEAKVTTITCAGNALKALAQAADAIPNEGGWVAKLVGDNSIATFGSYLPDLGSNLSSFASNLGTFDSAKVATVNSAVSAVKAVATLADSNLSGANTTIATFGNKLVGFGEDLADFCDKLNGVEGVSSAITNLKEFISAIESISSGAASTLASFGESLTKLGKDGVKSFVSAFSSSESKADVEKAASDLAKKAIDGIESKESTFEKACTDLVSNAASAMKTDTNYNKFYSAGSYLVSGFAAGISENDYKAEAKARAMATAAAKAAEDALDINSPSKVFRKIGTSVPEGFAMGIDRLRGMVVSSSVSMATSSVDSVRSAIGNLSSMINSDMDVQPTISPVLDLSNVKSGVGAISSLFDSSATLSAMGSISASMRRNSQNGANSDVVAAINKLRKDLGNVGNTYNSINGVTYDDGSGIADAVKTIVRAAKIERRV